MNQINMPLYTALEEFKQKNPISFHVPGHKNGLLMEAFNQNIVSSLQYDVTELSGLDDLHHAEGVISEAQQLLSHYYHSVKSYFLVNGTTVGNLAMILSVCKAGDYVLVDRNCHKSVLNALRIANVKPIFVFPTIDSDIKVGNGFQRSLVEQAFQQYKHIKACIFTYPNYYGMTYDLQSIIDCAHKHGSIVLVDEAHGPHFALGFPFPSPAAECGADMVVHSAHKMLPAMTMGSYLHVYNESIPIEKVEYYLSVLQSSSPSYPIMMSLDYARWYVANFTKEDISYTLKQRESFIKALRNIGIRVVETPGQDPLKLLISKDEVSGFDLQKGLEHVGLFSEMADFYRVVFVLPLLKKDVEYPYQEAIDRMNSAELETLPTIKGELKTIKFPEVITEPVLSYDEMERCTIEWVSIKQAKNCIAAKMIIPYPPGIPLLFPGEVITDVHIQAIQQLRMYRASLQGEHKLDEDKLAVFKLN
ncbi:aminotransferase class V-fold PLP-dependent enzyme [Bacillus ginsengihumi]|uniref:Aminotransferase class V-fold PLP-dependent enzyme n=1 Tax=Heyndrickxia ginsengihumi TaxID=363870 RepID=A0A6M0P9V7_9BACI|nr:aminotransferase class V-fold PLP-dependent enzyme [Heyndrickxia ginsengihumi]NEY21177.1 aminotransferase class V-fold PLP-dependent enzyme [Heyndrickxia ginsengihumi]